jgi:hypothetical protein
MERMFELVLQCPSSPETKVYGVSLDSNSTQYIMLLYQFLVEM